MHEVRACKSCERLASANSENSMNISGGSPEQDAIRHQTVETAKINQSSVSTNTVALKNSNSSLRTEMVPDPCLIFGKHDSAASGVMERLILLQILGGAALRRSRARPAAGARFTADTLVTGVRSSKIITTCRRRAVRATPRAAPPCEPESRRATAAATRAPAPTFRHDRCTIYARHLADYVFVRCNGKYDEGRRVKRALSGDRRVRSL
ncbi:hypothetical protein EVAR_35373_1 [Eumeta japonica]|uniref:Uncharacterized protein n=1 Tax=Eumeta variegata TaxID=151549 RepID=A0A4C2A0Y4_EUMVA|nr:hypothetical protein EVAR_35373_1 [Eumeta japonica]